MNFGRLLVAVFAVGLLLSGVFAASALSASEARQDWLDKVKIRLEKDSVHKQAKVDYNLNKTSENEQRFIDTGKDLLNSMLDEVESWLNWKSLEADESAVAPSDIKQNIKDDVDKNLAKIDGLRTDVENVKTRLELGLVSLKIIGAYVELLVDVSRNTGSMWVYIGNERIDRAEEFEAKLRASAESRDNNSDLIAKLDIAKAELGTARAKVSMADSAYKLVVTPGTPFIKFAEGNGYMAQARTNLLNAVVQMEYVLNTMARNG